MNPYRILGVSSDASDETVAKAHKALAKKYHPDLNPGNETAARKMGEINRAYDEIKAMRQHSASCQDGRAQTWRRSATGYNYRDYYKKPRVSLVWVFLAILVTALFVRLVLSLLFGGYTNYYYLAPGYGEMPGIRYESTIMPPVKGFYNP